jgi:hypothetical protein
MTSIINEICVALAIAHFNDKIGIISDLDTRYFDLKSLIRGLSFEPGTISRDKVSVHRSHDRDTHIVNDCCYPSLKGEPQ